MNQSNDNLFVSFWSLKVKTLLDELGFLTYLTMIILLMHK